MVQHLSRLNMFLQGKPSRVLGAPTDTRCAGWRLCQPAGACPDRSLCAPSRSALVGSAATASHKLVGRTRPSGWSNLAHCVVHLHHSALVVLATSDVHARELFFPFTTCDPVHELSLLVSPLLCTVVSDSARTSCLTRQPFDAAVLLLQRAAAAAGLAYQDRVSHLCLHPKYGAWFSLRCLLVFDGILYTGEALMPST